MADISECSATTPTARRVPRILQALIYGIAIMVLGGAVWVCSYVQGRMAAIAYVGGMAGELTFAPEPAWLPKGATLPEFMRTVERIGITRNCDVARFCALREVQHLGYIRGPVDDAGLRQIGTLRNLRTARISNVNATDLGTSCLRNCRRLEELTLYFAGISDRTLEPLADVPGQKAIGLPSCHLSMSTLHSIPRIQGLRTLDVMDTNLDDAGLALFADLPLEGLNLQGTQITDAGLKHLKRMPLKHLRLDRTRITDAGLADLASLPLEILEVCDTHVTGRGLLALRGMRLLEFVYIDVKQTTPEDLTTARDAGIPVGARRPRSPGAIVE